MRLDSTDGAELEIVPSRYEYAGTAVDQFDLDWDANWLVIRGRVRAPDGSTYGFLDPCLTTWEAQELARWLETVASGTAKASTSDNEPALTFTEPNLGFGLGPASGNLVTVRAHFSLESTPPHHSWTELYDYSISLTMSASDLAAAASQWRDEIAAFPVRGLLLPVSRARWRLRDLWTWKR